MGAVLNLGEARSVVGDILTEEKEAYLFCSSKMTDFFLENLFRIRHTEVMIEKIENLAELPKQKMESISGTCASVRLDSLISLAFQSSRSSMVAFKKRCR